MGRAWEELDEFRDLGEQEGWSCRTLKTNIKSISMADSCQCMTKTTTIL